MNEAPARRKWTVYAGMAVSATLLAVVLWQVDRMDLAATLRSLGWAPFAVAVAGYLAAFCAVAWRFGRAVGRLTNEPVRAPAVLTVYLPIILATNLLAHGISIGAEVARLLFLKRVHQLSVQTALALLLVDRLVGVGVVTVFALISAVAVFWPGPVELRAGTLGAALALLVIAALVVPRLPPPHFLPRQCQALGRIIAAYLGSAGRIVEQILVSGVAVGGLAVAVFSVSRSVGSDIPFGIALAATPIVYIGSSVPFTYAGWGSRELACIAVLAWTGWMSTADAVVVSVTLGVAAFVGSLPGLVSLRSSG